MAKDGPRPDEPDSGRNLGCDPRRVDVAAGVHITEPIRAGESEDRRTQGDDRVRPNARAPTRRLSLETDHRTPRRQTPGWEHSEIGCCFPPAGG